MERGGGRGFYLKFLLGVEMPIIASYFLFGAQIECDVKKGVNISVVMTLKISYVI